MIESLAQWYLYGQLWYLVFGLGIAVVVFGGALITAALASIFGRPDG